MVEQAAGGVFPAHPHAFKTTATELVLQGDPAGADTFPDGTQTHELGAAVGAGVGMY